MHNESSADFFFLHSPKIKTMKILYIFLFGLFSSTLAAQSIERSVIGSSGTSAQAGDLQLDYTVGEAVINTLSTPDLTLTQGFHQGVLQTTGLTGLPLEIGYQIYPNPVTSELWLSMQGPDLNFWALIYDATGRPLGVRRQIKASGYWKEAFDLSAQAPGAYFLVIMDGKGAWLESHKVMKL
jgi:hypothetical protein